jgi:hypothetical protein
MDENMIRKSVLAPQCNSVQQRVCSIAPAGIDVMGSENDFLAYQLIEERDNRSVKKREFVVP